MSTRRLATHDEIAALLRELHAAGVPHVLLELTGPGWIVEYPQDAAQPAHPWPRVPWWRSEEPPA